MTKTAGSGAHLWSRWTELLRRHRRLVAITASGFLLRLGWMLHTRPVPVSDFNDYRTLALDILDHGQFGYPDPTIFFLPGHPTYLALFATISRSDMWLSLATVTVSSISIVLAYFLGREVVGTARGGEIAAGIFALFPTFVAFSPILATEHLFITLALAAILALTQIDRNYVGALVPAGILTGLAVLTRGEMVFYIPAALIWIWFGWRDAATRRRFRATLVFGAAIAVIVMPWYVRNTIVVGPEAGLSASAGMNFYFAHNDSGTYGDFIEGNALYGLPPEEAGSLGWQLGFEHIRAHPLNLVRDFWVGTQRLFAPPEYATFWPTQGADYYGDPDFYQREVRFAGKMGDLARVGTMGLIAIAGLSVLVLPIWTRSFAFLIIPLALSSWGLRTVLYWAKPRYAYFITVMFVFAAAVVIDLLMSKRSPIGRTQGV